MIACSMPCRGVAVVYAVILKHEKDRADRGGFAAASFCLPGF